MSVQTLTRSADDFGDDLAVFLATVPAAADFDRDELDRLPKVPVRRPGRSNSKRAAIAESERGA